MNHWWEKLTEIKTMDGFKDFIDVGKKILYEHINDNTKWHKNSSSSFTSKINRKPHSQDYRSMRQTSTMHYHHHVQN